MDTGSTTSEETLLEKIHSFKTVSTWAVICTWSEVVAADQGTKILTVLQKLLLQKTRFKEECRATFTTNQANDEDNMVAAIPIMGK